MRSPDLRAALSAGLPGGRKRGPAGQRGGWACLPARTNRGARLRRLRTRAAARRSGREWVWAGGALGRPLSLELLAMS